MSTKERRQIGAIAVDSGTVMLIDPCYVSGEGETKADPYKEIVDEDGKALYPNGYVEVARGLGLVVLTTHGDGMYPVYGTFKNDRLTKVEIDFDEY